MPDDIRGQLALTPPELLARAELAGPALIVSVTRATDDTSPHVARLRFDSFTKGRPRSRNAREAVLGFRRLVDVKMRRVVRDANGVPAPGHWTPGYRAGDRVMTHLVWDDALEGYTTLCWNAVWQIPV